MTEGEEQEKVQPAIDELEHRLKLAQRLQKLVAKLETEEVDVSVIKEKHSHEINVYIYSDDVTDTMVEMADEYTTNGIISYKPSEKQYELTVRQNFIR